MKWFIIVGIIDWIFGGSGFIYSIFGRSDPESSDHYRGLLQASLFIVFLHIVILLILFFEDGVQPWWKAIMGSLVATIGLCAGFLASIQPLMECLSGAKKVEKVLNERILQESKVQAFSELETGNIDKLTWAEAMVAADGNQETAKAEYLKLRRIDAKDSKNLQAVAELESGKLDEVTWTRAMEASHKDGFEAKIKYLELREIVLKES